jgi:hypothetical protein
VISFDSRVVMADSVLFREVRGEAVILNLQTETYFGLDETGTRMLSVLLTSETIGKAYDSLLQEYDVEPERLRHDIHELIQKLQTRGIIQLQPPEPSCA